MQMDAIQTQTGIIPMQMGDIQMPMYVLIVLIRCRVVVVIVCYVSARCQCLLLGEVNIGVLCESLNYFAIRGPI